MKKTTDKSDNDKNKYPPNLYKVGDSWMIDFIYRGERYRENIGPVSKTVAKETVSKRKAAAAEGRLDVGPKIEDLTFEKACEKYLEWYKVNRKAYTFQKYATPASKALKAFFGKYRLSQISAFLIERYKLDRKTSCSCVGGPTPNDKSDRCAECKHLTQAKSEVTVNRELTLLKHMFNLCVKWKFAKANPMRDVKMFREDNGRTRYLGMDEAHNLLAACNPELRIVVLAAMHTGFRKSELKSLRWTNIDFVNGSATVQSCYSKNGETRTVPLTEDLARELQQLKEGRQPSPNDPVFTRDGKAWKCWREAFDGAVQRAGLKDFRFHDLRHCFGSWLAMNGVVDKGRMELMGHKDPKMTMRYTHLTMDYKRQAASKLPKFGTEIMSAESPQISPSSNEGKVVSFRK